MSDRFKFRVWNSVTKQWLHMYKKLGGCSLYGETMLFGCWLDGVNISDLDKVVIEQCTGLEDKNGVLIYEGDIVMYAQESNLTASCTMIGPHAVIWNPFEARFELDGVVAQTMGFIFKAYKILGNIHENPELLTK